MPRGGDQTGFVAAMIAKRTFGGYSGQYCYPLYILGLPYISNKLIINMTLYVCYDKKIEYSNELSLITISLILFWDLFVL